MSTLDSMALAALVVCFGLSACANHDDPSPAYNPGLGELMTFTQIRHAKLWMAGAAGNWELAAYETDELEEGFRDVVTYHPTHQDAPLPLKEVLPAMTNAPLVALRTAIGRRDQAAFEVAFDSLTAGCNNCHQALKHGFNVVRRPIAGGFPNQDFTPPAVTR